MTPANIAQLDYISTLTNVDSIDNLALKTYKIITTSVLFYDKRKKNQSNGSLSRSLVSWRHSGVLRLGKLL